MVAESSVGAGAAAGLATDEGQECITIPHPGLTKINSTEAEQGSTSSQLRLTITQSEASTSCGDEGQDGLEVEAAFIESHNLLEPSAIDMVDRSSPAAAVVSPLKSDSTVEESAEEGRETLSSMPPSVNHLDSDNAVAPAHSPDSDRQGSPSPNSVAGMGSSCSPEQAKVLSNESADSSSSKHSSLLRSLSLNEDRARAPVAINHLTLSKSMPLEDDGAGTSAAINKSPSTSQSEEELASLGASNPIKSITKSSSMLDVLLANAPNASEVESASVILSDAGDSKCTSIAPVINMTASGEDPHDEKLVALGVFVKAASASSAGQSADPDDSMVGNTSMDANTSSSGDVMDVLANGNAIKTTTSSASDSPLNDIEGESDAKVSVLGRNFPIDTTVPEAGVSRKSSSSSESPRKPSGSPIPISPNSVSSSGYDKKRLSERLKQRLAKRNQMQASAESPTKCVDTGVADVQGVENSPLSRSFRPRQQWETRLQAASRQKRRSKSHSKSIDSNDGMNSDILSKYSASSELDRTQSPEIYPDTVTFSDGEEDPGPSALRINTKIASRDRRSAYRKCVSEVGVSLSLSTRSARSKLSKHHHSHHHRIGILQADGIVYDDAMLLRLARQARYGRLRGEVTHITEDAKGANGDNLRYNDVKIHVYDLLTKDSLVEVPYFNCNFPIGQCFKVVNDGCHVLGTGAYHVGVEVNGVEYAFGANNIIGMSGIFTCVPKESPGYEFRETLEFGKVHTTKRTWIRIPKSGTGISFNTISAALAESNDSDEKNTDESKFFPESANEKMKDLYSFREIESFADGHAIIHSMAREYMGTDYDLLRKNCCTFARDVCIRLGVKEDEIPNWFHNAAKAGADAEDAITNVENSVRNMLDCAGEGDPLDMECYNHGFEVIMDEKSAMKLKVVESPSMRSPRERRPLTDELCDSMHETASWTY